MRLGGFACYKWTAILLTPKMPIMKTETPKVGDLIEICNTDYMVRDFITSRILRNLDINHLRALCSIKENKKYEVTSVCRSCKYLKIEVGDNYLPIDFEYVSLNKKEEL